MKFFGVLHFAFRLASAVPITIYVGHNTDHSDLDSIGSIFIPPDAMPLNISACPGFCEGTKINPSLTQKFICGDSRLGPVELPTTLPLSTTLFSYRRFNGSCPKDFLKAHSYYNETEQKVKWNFSSTTGIQMSTNNKQIEGTIKLEVGTLIDRFGSPNGSYSSPFGTPYVQRSIPPENLSCRESKTQQSCNFNYHVFEVLEEFIVSASIIAPAFGQIGRGTQYFTKPLLDLVDDNLLRKVDWEHIRK